VHFSGTSRSEEASPPQSRVRSRSGGSPPTAPSLARIWRNALTRGEHRVAVCFDRIDQQVEGREGLLVGQREACVIDDLSWTEIRCLGVDHKTARASTITAIRELALVAA